MESEKLSPDQRGPFSMRMGMLESYLTGSSGASFQSNFKAGHLVIVDLRDPFINTSMASALFDIIVEIFLDVPISSGKVLRTRFSARPSTFPDTVCYFELSSCFFLTSHLTSLG